MTISEKYQYQCISCAKTYPAGQVRYVCPDCEKLQTQDFPPSGILKVGYDYDSLKKSGKSFSEMAESAFIDLLPIEQIKSLPFLDIGNTPLYEPKPGLFLKDDSQNPTFSFKDRASALVSAYAREHGLNTIVTASTGNAGSSLAGICAAQKQRAIIIVPESAPVAKLTQIMMYGAQIVPVRGTYDDAFDLSIAASNTHGWYNRNTAYNPLTIEGKKTVSFEIFRQMGMNLPNRIFVPVGDGVIISGVYKGFEDLLRLGFIRQMPTIVAVQAKGSDNLVRNLYNQDFQLKESQTMADSISVDIPRNFYMAQQFIKKYEGKAVSLSDEEILQASSKLSKEFGLFAEPAAAAAYAGYLAFHQGSAIPNETNDLVLLTGSGLKDISAVKPLLNIPKAIHPNLSELENIIS